MSRWFLLVPGYVERALDPSATPVARSDAVSDFETAHDALGTIVGESLGYAFTAAWTILVILAFPAAPRWWRTSGSLTAFLILLGVLVPLGVPGTDFANFAGYVLWSLWLVAVAALLVGGELDAGNPSDLGPRRRPIRGMTSSRETISTGRRFWLCESGIG